MDITFSGIWVEVILVKLVRDKIPELLKKQNIQLISRNLESVGYLLDLKGKLAEEPS